MVKFLEKPELDEMICPLGGGHMWTNREWMEGIEKWHDYCSKCGVERFFTTMGYVLLKKGDLTYELRPELKDF
jgi:hypothetical protein